MCSHIPGPLLLIHRAATADLISQLAIVYGCASVYLYLWCTNSWVAGFYCWLLFTALSTRIRYPQQCFLHQTNFMLLNILDMQQRYKQWSLWYAVIQGICLW